MTRWWLRPAVRIAAAILLPFLVPLIITLMIWALPGDPASIICPPETCGAGGTSALAERWNLDGGPMAFFSAWMSDAIVGNFGNSWRLIQGVPISELLVGSIPNTLFVIALALVPISLGVVGVIREVLPERFSPFLLRTDVFNESSKRSPGRFYRQLSVPIDPILYVAGLVPSVVLALLATALVELNFAGASSDTGQWIRILAGAGVLAVADGAFSGAVTGTRSIFKSENRQRYVGVAVLRGESRLSNTLPNVLPALTGQLRARILHLLSGAVVVETVIEINGLGDLLWGGTLLQDFGVVLACATCFALISAALLLVQAFIEIGAAAWIRRAPPVHSREGVA